MKYLLGIDNGLTAIKACLFDLSGHCVKKSVCSTPVVGDEIDTAELWELTAKCIKEVVSGVSEDIVCVANSGHGNGLYMIDKNKIPVSKAVTSMSDREKIQAEYELFDINSQKSWSGQPAYILKWLKENDSTTYNKTDKILMCKDFIRYKLTDEIVSDYSDMSAAGLINTASKQYDRKIFSLLGIEEAFEFLPGLVESCDIAGYVSEKAATETGLKAKTPVAAGAFDVLACSLGMGIDDGIGIIAGTWGVCTSFSNNLQIIKDIRQTVFAADKDTYLFVDSEPNSAGNLEWFKKIINIDDYGLIDGIVEKSADADVLYFPYLYQNSHKGCFFGLDFKHTKEDLLKAVFEGICFEHKMQTEKLMPVVKKSDFAVLSGGVTASDVWAQMFADVLNIPVSVTRETQAGALGAAMTAAVAFGIYDNIKEAKEKMVGIKKIFYPQKDYTKKYNKYKSISKIIKEL